MKTLYTSTPFQYDVAVLDQDGRFQAGLLISYEIIDLSDNSTLESGLVAETITGLYFVALNIATVGQYCIRITPPLGYEQGEEVLNVNDNVLADVQETVNTIDANVLTLHEGIDALAVTLSDIINSIQAHRDLTEDRLARILGLVQENYRVVSPTYDSNGDLVSSTLKLYSSAADCNNDVSPLAEYSVIAVYNVDHQLTSYKVVKV